MEINLFDPTIPAQPESIDYAPRPSALDNLRVALVENTKHNSRTILLKLFEQLEKRYHLQLAGIFRKASAGHPIGDPDVEACARSADIAIAGIGD